MRTHRVLATLHLAVSSVLGNSGPVVKLSAGTVHGGKCSNGQTNLFEGIPYAQPPVGKLRFMPPQPLKDSYDGGSLDATKAPPICIQFPSSLDVTDQPASEDCLYLDVYVPSNATSNSALPVKVWGYGGANEAGSLSYPLYNSCNLAQDAIVVTFNYRLGSLGFLGLETAGIKGNMAIQDYLAALRWVKSNIAAFGGDSSTVVLFGQSAGGDDTFTVSTLPEAKSLISAAILESGGGQDLTSKSLAQYCGESYATTLNCSIHDSVAELREAFTTTPALLDPSLNGDNLAAIYGFNLPNITNLNSAILDGEIIKEEPLKVGSQVPIIGGSAELDSSLFVLPVFLGTGEPITEANYTEFLARWGSLGPVIGKEYPLSLFNASGSTEEAVMAAITHIATVSSYGCQTYRALRAAVAAGTPTFAYRFDHTPSFPWLWINGTAFPGKYAKYFGATHTSELPFVFGNLDDQPWGNGTANGTTVEREMSRTLIEAWTAMAAKGNPSTVRQHWPRFGKCQDTGLYIQDGFKSTSLDFTECQFWDAIWAKLGAYNVPWPSKTECPSNSTGSSAPTKSVGTVGASATGTPDSSPSAPTHSTSVAGRTVERFGMAGVFCVVAIALAV
ncbi:Carboxylesterase [Ilyonectria robusta]|uniref:Carboxylesterase n=1 Tax=Ilyonectria robusta TaxID=1079257 RepID=UPI001E8EEBB1|nr:Carboxylesterase [Ilyonectria robusta]KAH8684052.1 Carboxylesterase [Ilyonectria robusta]